MDKQIGLFTTNFWDYDHVNPPPMGIDITWDTIYITDSDEMASKALSIGWTRSQVVKDYVDISDPFERRKLISKFRYEPEIFTSLENYDRIFFMDSNVVSVDPLYMEWANRFKDDKVLLTQNGWYSGKGDTLIEEFRRSFNQGRWSYNSKNMRNRKIYYQNEMKLDLSTIPVSSAKYLGWNMTHPNKKIVSDWLFKESSIHLQGNIIVSIATLVFPEDIQTERIKFLADLTSHKKYY